MKTTAHQKKVLNSLLHEILLLRDKKCLRCGKPEFQMSHIYPKGRYRLMEYEPDNLKALCYSCHLGWWHKNPIEAHEWLVTVILKKRLDRLKMMSNTQLAPFDYKLQKVYLEHELTKLKLI